MFYSFYSLGQPQGLVQYLCQLFGPQNSPHKALYYSISLNPCKALVITHSGPYIIRSRKRRRPRTNVSSGRGRARRQGSGSNNNNDNNNTSIVCATIVISSYIVK